MTKRIGILTAGSDCPGLNASIRSFGKAANGYFQMQVIGFRDGFLGLVNNHTAEIASADLSGILTAGGTILGTSREMPWAIRQNGELVDRINDAVKTYHANKLDALLCIGGKETQTASLRLKQAGLNVVSLPKSTNNDVAITETTIGFDTARSIGAEAIDRLHSTANANHRIIIAEVLGRTSGWLTLGAGIAAGADVILIPEIPYAVDKIAEAVLQRNRAGKHFSLIAVAEGAKSAELMAFFDRSRQMSEKIHQGEALDQAGEKLNALISRYNGETMVLANRLEEATGLESRITILGYLLRGGTPTAADRLLATQMATMAASLINKGKYGVMIAVKGGKLESVPLEDVADQQKLIPAEHPWILSARQVGTCLGD